jgi:U3 small nucleolar ribonucleoprotein component
MELAKDEGEPTAKLSHKLDALCDFTFSPKPQHEEISIITHNTPAIQMEEVKNYV